MRSAIVALLLAAAGCTQQKSPEEVAAEQFIADALARTSTVGTANGATVTQPVTAGDTARPVSEQAPLEFHGYPCTEDCSGHEAGYAWAERNGVDDPDDCGGNSQSFIEGCQAWANEQEPEPESAEEESGEVSSDPDGF